MDVRGNPHVPCFISMIQFYSFCFSHLEQTKIEFDLFQYTVECAHLYIHFSDSTHICLVLRALVTTILPSLNLFNLAQGFFYYMQQQCILPASITCSIDLAALTESFRLLSRKDNNHSTILSMEYNKPLTCLMIKLKRFILIFVIFASFSDSVML